MILLVTGGSASGKSEYAENRALQMSNAEHRPLVYLATMMPFGEDAEKRIERHRQLRAGKGFETVERYADIETLCHGDGPDSANFRKKAGGAVVMLECMSNLTANEMFADTNSAHAKTAGESQDTKERSEGISEKTENVRDRILRGIDALAKTAAHLVIVSINVFDEGVQQYDSWTQSYMQCLGELNRALTIRADEAVEVVYSIPVVYKEVGRCSH